MVDDLGCNNIEEHGEQAVCKTTYMKKVKGSAGRPFTFSVMEIEEWKQHVPGNYVTRFIKPVGYINCISKKLYCMNLKFDYS